MSGKGPPLAVIAGPTASGKSALALALAEQEKGVVINADASQVYADLAILSARPGPDDMARAPHRLFGCTDGAEAMTAARWATLARAEIAAAHTAGRLPILVGGTGLYLRTLLEGIAPVPAVPEGIRAAVRALEAAAVRAALEAEDPAMAARLHPHDRQRNARALEVVRASGRSLAAWQAAPPEGGLAVHVQLRPLVIEIGTDRLDARIAERIGAMWAGGALEEVRRLAARRLSPALPVMRAIGVPPLIAHLAGRLAQEEALARWQLDTRRYAKRQRTWLRNQLGHWPRLAAPG
jgi:tRNA dimethylallyltransferase